MYSGDGTMTFADLLEALNEGGTRRPGQWTPSACAVWRNASPEDARLMEAAVAVELTTGRWVRSSDEDEVRARLAAMDAATAEVRAARRMDDDEKTTADTISHQDITDIAINTTLSLVPFDFEELDVRVMDRDGMPWFILADVCRVLGLRNPSMVAKSLDDDEIVTIDTKNLPPGVADPRAQQIRLISEAGLYSLIMTSQKPQALRFRKWITAEVLPQIRKTGSYSAVPVAPTVDVMQALNDPATMRDLLLTFNEKVPS